MVYTKTGVKIETVIDVRAVTPQPFKYIDLQAWCLTPIMAVSMKL